MKDLTAFELKFVLDELSILANAKLDKIYHPKRKEFLFRFHVKKEGKKMLRFLLPDLFYLTDFKEDYGQPSGFCMFLRKRLEGCSLVAVIQKGFERIVEFVFEGKDKYIMIVELFSKGNLVLCDEDYNIISPLDSQEWKDRKIKQDNKYKYPGMENNFFEIDLKEFKKLVEKSNKGSIVKTLAVDLGLGGFYSEEICLRAKIDKKKKDLTENEVEKLFETIDNIRNEGTNAKVVFEDGKIIDVTPIETLKYEDFETKNFDSFNEALDFALKEKIYKKKDTQYTQELERVKRIIKDQKKTIKNLERKENESREKAELLYKKYKVVDEILREINKARNKYSWDEIKEKLKGHDTVKQINEKEGKIVIDLEE